MEKCRVSQNITLITRHASKHDANTTLKCLFRQRKFLYLSRVFILSGFSLQNTIENTRLAVAGGPRAGETHQRLDVPFRRRKTEIGALAFSVKSPIFRPFVTRRRVRMVFFGGGGGGRVFVFFQNFRVQTVVYAFGDDRVVALDAMNGARARRAYAGRREGGCHGYRDGSVREGR